MFSCLGVCVRWFRPGDAVPFCGLSSCISGAMDARVRVLSYTKSYIPEVMMQTLLNRNNPIGCMCRICDKAWLIIERERERERETDIVSERNLGMCCEAFECCMYIKVHI